MGGKGKGKERGGKGGDEKGGKSKERPSGASRMQESLLAATALPWTPLGGVYSNTPAH